MVAFNTKHAYAVASKKVHNVQLLYTARHSMHYCIVTNIDTCMCQPVPVGHDKILQLFPCTACKYYVARLYLVLYCLYVLSGDFVRERLVQHPHGKQADTDLAYGIYNFGFISLVTEQQLKQKQQYASVHDMSFFLRTQRYSVMMSWKSFSSH